MALWNGFYLHTTMCVKKLCPWTRAGHLPVSHPQDCLLRQGSLQNYVFLNTLELEMTWLFIGTGWCKELMAGRHFQESLCSKKLRPLDWESRKGQKKCRESQVWGNEGRMWRNAEGGEMLSLIKVRNQLKHFLLLQELCAYCFLPLPGLVIPPSHPSHSMNLRWNVPSFPSPLNIR